MCAFFTQTHLRNLFYCRCANLIFYFLKSSGKMLCEWVSEQAGLYGSMRFFVLFMDLFFVIFRRKRKSEMKNIEFGIWFSFGRVHVSTSLNDAFDCSWRNWLKVDVSVCVDVCKYTSSHISILVLRYVLLPFHLSGAQFQNCIFVIRYGNPNVYVYTTAASAFDTRYALLWCCFFFSRQQSSFILSIV